MDSSEDYAQVHKKLECIIKQKQHELFELKEKTMKMEPINIPLKKTHQLLQEEMVILKTSLKREKEKYEELSKKIANIEWEQTKSQLNTDCEQFNMDIYINTMEQIKKDVGESNDDTSLLKKKKEKNLNAENSNMDKKIVDKSNERRIQLEAMAAQYRMAVLEQQDKYFEVESQNAILTKRNAAKLLRLRKGVQESEDSRKQMMERIQIEHRKY